MYSECCSGGKAGRMIREKRKMNRTKRSRNKTTRSSEANVMR
jgi:hypothetical protein